VLATLGSLEDDSPWRALDALDTIRGSSLLVVAPKSSPEREDAWRDATEGRSVKRLVKPLVADEAARVLAQNADAVLFWEREESDRLASSVQVRAALAAAVPIVASRCRRYADVASATYQPRELVGGIQEVLDNDVLRLELGERAREYCEEHSWRRMAQRHLDLWHSFETT
jgi:glycosyltransferase involved in cell wall biosynthesis